LRQCADRKPKWPCRFALMSGLAVIDPTDG
jgi:hypothetical protein